MKHEKRENDPSFGGWGYTFLPSFLSFSFHNAILHNTAYRMLLSRSQFQYLSFSQMEEEEEQSEAKNGERSPRGTEMNRCCCCWSDQIFIALLPPL